MSVPNKSQPCQSDTSYCKFASETLLKLLACFEDQINGVIKNEEDIEFVHKTRVSSRRLRAALSLFRFCYPAKEFKKWSSQIKKVTRLLGEARDLDVQIAFIEQYIKTPDSEAEREGICILLKDYKDHRKSIQSSVVSELEKTRSIRHFREYSQVL